jgi:bacterioferritin-associated ferredoxin
LTAVLGVAAGCGACAHHTRCMLESFIPARAIDALPCAAA